MLEFDFEIEGTVVSSCGRCMEPVTIEVEGEHHLIVKFASEFSQEDDEIMSIPASEFEFDVSEHLQELVVLSMPARVVHGEGKCDPEMWDKLSQHLNADEPENKEDNEELNDDDVDPRWAALKKLKNNNDTK